MKYFIIENNSNETLEVITEKTLEKNGIILKSEDLKAIEDGLFVEIFGWGLLSRYTNEKIKEYRNFYEAEGWDYIENLCL